MDNLKISLYGRIAKVTLADGKEYVIREPSIDALESLQIDQANPGDLKNIRQLAWAAFKEDNPDVSQAQFGKLITFSMITQDAPFLKTLLEVIGLGGGTEKNGVKRE